MGIVILTPEEARERVRALTDRREITWCRCPLWRSCSCGNEASVVPSVHARRVEGGPVRIVCRPLLDWPGRMRSDRERDPGHRFRAGWSDTTALLEREAEKIGGHDIVIQLAVPESDIRLDGWPYARAKPSHPGVTIVTPDTKHGRLSWSTDRYMDWKHNVRAIALSMEALRAADRHGIMQGRQYAGFRELGAGDTGGLMTVEDAARFIAEHAGGPHVYRDQVAWARNNGYRLAAKKLHPDAGGDPAMFRRLEEAKRLLDEAGAR